MNACLTTLYLVLLGSLSSAGPASLHPKARKPLLTSTPSTAALGRPAVKSANSGGRERGTSNPYLPGISRSGTGGDECNLKCHICHKNFAGRPQALKSHYALSHLHQTLRRKYWDAAMICFYCGREFKSNMLLIHHIGVDHDMVRMFLPQHIWKDMELAQNKGTVSE